MAGMDLLQFRQRCRYASHNPLICLTIVAIYNAAIPGRMATADTVPVTVAQREPWFRDFSPTTRPLWVCCDAKRARSTAGSRSARSTDAPPTTRPSSSACTSRRTRSAAASRGRCSAHALAQAPALRVRTLLAFVFGHNAPSIALFERAGFSAWGRLPRVAELDGVERDLVILGLRVA